MEKLRSADVYSKGERTNIGKEANEVHVTVFREYLQKIETGESEAYICFDVDGTLIKSTDYETGKSTPLETLGNQQSIEEYVKANSKNIEIFKNRIAALQRYGFKYMINTGRSVKFAQRLAEHIFPEDSLAVIIGEGGAGILERDESGSWKIELTKPETVRVEDYQILSNNKTAIEDIGRALGGTVESGKQVIVSVHPPQSMSVSDFEQHLKDEMQSKDIPIEQLFITHSSSAVDIGPKGASKIASLKQILGKNIAIYFGDAQNDAKALEGSLVNVVVGNADADIQDIAKKAELGIVVHPSHKDMSGSIEGLRGLELLIRAGGMKRTGGQ